MSQTGEGLGGAIRVNRRESADGASLGSIFEEQRAKTRLHEMLMSRQRFLNAVLLHDRERDAVGQSPVLIGPRRMKLQCTLEQVGREWYYVDVPAGSVLRLGPSGSSADWSQRHRDAES